MLFKILIKLPVWSETNSRNVDLAGKPFLLLMSSKNIIFGGIGYRKMRNDDNDCKCILSSYNNVLSDKTQKYFFLIIPGAKASYNILYFSYDFWGLYDS